MECSEDPTERYPVVNLHTGLAQCTHTGRDTCGEESLYHAFVYSYGGSSFEYRASNDVTTVRIVGEAKLTLLRLYVLFLSSEDRDWDILNRST